MLRNRGACALRVLLAAAPAQAGGGLWPADGVYCGPAGTRAIVVAGTSLGIDGLDCRGGLLRAGRYVAQRCFADGGSVVDVDTDLAMRPDGSLMHDGAVLRRARPPCP
ncbi:hypothetical protein [Methylobacterium sp. 37f]|uniref:hypothetical protein n=1 Tax=Methylobacterium sp. 37f TaxID=2817058 RepID=UPI001FFCAA9B|nr:hypothetical protein [Methylobacterium sp. 37f]MCK2055287.1 hypothetical protein [Methylobacterium sp. 37f]